jgi:hypothetical protein
MWRPVVEVLAAADGTGRQDVGLGFFILQSRGDTFVGHTGSQAGFRAFLWLNPRTRSAAIVALNTENLTPGAPATLAKIQSETLGLLR